MKDGVNTVTVEQSENPNTQELIKDNVNTNLASAYTF